MNESNGHATNGHNTGDPPGLESMTAVRMGLAWLGTLRTGPLGDHLWEAWLEQDGARFKDVTEEGAVRAIWEARRREIDARMAAMPRPTIAEVVARERSRTTELTKK